MATLHAIPTYELRLRKARTLRLAETHTRDSSQAASVLHAMIGATDREHFVVVYLDSQHAIIGASVEHVGGQSTIGMIDARCVFRAAIIARAHAIVIGHNHPSGDPTPSDEDIACTRALQTAGAALGLTIVDHLIVTRDPARWCSLRSMREGLAALQGQ